MSGRHDRSPFFDACVAVGGRHRAPLSRLAARAGTADGDVVPLPAMAAGVATRHLHAAPGAHPGGSTLDASNPRRTRASHVADIVAGPDRAARTAADVHWDRVVAIEPAGMEPVYDLTVDPHHNFVAGGIVVHNSIEQDADLVIFIYRDEYYFPETTEHPGEAELIIAKHRNGGLGTVPLTFQNEYPRFLGLQRAA